MAAPLYRTRLQPVFARSAPKAVILRRGPRKHFHLIAWNLETDHFEHGQWMKGHVVLCDLSPDGERLLYWAHQYHASAAQRRVAETAAENADSVNGYDPLRQWRRQRSPRRGEHRRRTPRYMSGGANGAGSGRARRMCGAWTALSRPPYFTALALWPSDGHWTGGGYLPERDTIVLAESADGLIPRLSTPRPKGLRILQAGAASAPPRPCPSSQEDWGADGQDPAQRWSALQEIVSGLRLAGARWVEFVSPQLDGDLLFACDGVVYRLSDWRAKAAQDRLAAARPLIDLTPLSFRRIPPPPDALEW